MGPDVVWVPLATSKRLFAEFSFNITSAAFHTVMLTCRCEFHFPGDGDETLRRQALRGPSEDCIRGVCSRPDGARARNHGEGRHSSDMVCFKQMVLWLLVFDPKTWLKSSG